MVVYRIPQSRDPRSLCPFHQNVQPGSSSCCRSKTENAARMESRLVLILPRPLPHLPNTFTTPSPPAPTTHRPSALQTTLQTPSPRMIRRLVISCVHARFSNDQKRRLASCPPLTSSAPDGDRLSEEMAEGWASMS